MYLRQRQHSPDTEGRGGLKLSWSSSFIFCPCHSLWTPAGFGPSGFVSDMPPCGGPLGIIHSFTCTWIYVHPCSFIHSFDNDSAVFDESLWVPCGMAGTEHCIQIKVGHNPYPPETYCFLWERNLAHIFEFSAIRCSSEFQHQNITQRGGAKRRSREGGREQWGLPGYSQQDVSRTLNEGLWQVWNKEKESQSRKYRIS